MTDKEKIAFEERISAFLNGTLSEDEKEALIEELKQESQKLKDQSSDASSEDKRNIALSIAEWSRQ